jgi:hypothetical protein
MTITTVEFILIFTPVPLWILWVIYKSFTHPK